MWSRGLVGGILFLGLCATAVAEQGDRVLVELRDGQRLRGELLRFEDGVYRLIDEARHPMAVEGETVRRLVFLDESPQDAIHNILELADQREPARQKAALRQLKTLGDLDNARTLGALDKMASELGGERALCAEKLLICYKYEATLEEVERAQKSVDSLCRQLSKAPAALTHRAPEDAVEAFEFPFEIVIKEGAAAVPALLANMEAELDPDVHPMTLTRRKDVVRPGFLAISGALNRLEKPAIESLVRLYRRSEAPRQRMVAMQLASMGKPAREPLYGLMTSNLPTASRRIAAWGLALTGDDRAETVLADTLEEASPIEKAMIANALRHVPQAWGLKLLARLLEDESAIPDCPMQSRVCDEAALAMEEAVEASQRQRTAAPVTFVRWMDDRQIRQRSRGNVETWRGWWQDNRHDYETADGDE